MEEKPAPDTAGDLTRSEASALVQQAVLAERRRCLELHKLCTNHATPALYRDFVRRRVDVAFATEEVLATLAGRHPQKFQPLPKEL
ncbi:MAG: hypothetical protein IH614_11725 [Desulfuromonadales bacterium]|nr:hypothetical protein [Desulfuromonadales bacterium]